MNKMLFFVYIVLLAALIVSLVLHLIHSLKKTIYAYRNACFIAGILYSSLFLIVSVYHYFAYSRECESFNVFVLFKNISSFPQDFAIFALPIVLTFSFAIFISNLALIRHEGFRVTNLLGAVLGGMVLLATIGAQIASNLIYTHILVPTGIINSKEYITFRTSFWMFVMMLICYFECILVGACIMGYVASRHIPAYDKDYIIILGCRIDKEGGLLPLLKLRTNKAIHFAWDQEIATGKSVRFVPSGGQAENEIMSEGSAIEMYLISHGAENYEVYPEKKSSNTYQNLLFSKKIIDELNPDAKIAFATTNYHVYRSGILARRAGFDAEGIASKTKWYFWPNGFIREFFGILSINKKAHICAALICFATSAILGLLSYMSL